MTVKIMAELSPTHKLPVDIEVSGNSNGGANYLNRVLKHAQDTSERNIYIGITPGAYQDSVAKTVKTQYELLNNVCRAPFNLSIVKQHGCY